MTGLKQRPTHRDIGFELRSVDQLSDDERRDLKALSAAVYPPRPPRHDAEVEPSPAFEWATPQWSILIRNSSRQLVSHVGLLTRVGLCDDIEIYIGGIGGVETHPSHRRKGYAGAGLERAIEYLRQELQVDISLLFCGPSMLNYYGRFGFSNVASDTFVRQNGAKVIMPRSEVMVMPALKPLPQCGSLDLCGLPW